MKRKLCIAAVVLFALSFLAVPVRAVFDEANLGTTLNNLNYELKRDYKQISAMRDRMAYRYDDQHKKMVDVIKDCNKLSLMLYSQKQDYTFDMSYALEKISKQYEEFNRDKRPYDQIVGNLDAEITRYARLIEALRRLPPELAYVGTIPDSLAYKNGTLERHKMQIEGQSLELELEKQVDSLSKSAFYLDEEGQRDRDTCIFYASELLKVYAESKEIAIADSTHYQEAFLRLKESYDYATEYYKRLQDKIFIEGQTPWPAVLKDNSRFWSRAVLDLLQKYNAEGLVAHYGEETSDAEEAQTDEYGFMQGVQHDYSLLMVNGIVHLCVFLFMWGLIALLSIPAYRFIKPVGKAVPKQSRRYVNLLVTCIVFLICVVGKMESELIGKMVGLTNTFIWLLAAILAALLIRLKPDSMKSGMRLYKPTIFLALIIIVCRALFFPNSAMNYFFPPLLIIFFIWQLLVCLIYCKKAEKVDRFMAWGSLLVTGVSMAAAIMGYIFLAMLIFAWWCFQLAVVHTMATIRYLLQRYKDKWLDDKIARRRSEITFVKGAGKESLLMSVTWFYDLVREVLLPCMAIWSVPFCLHLALDIFDFNDLFSSVYNNPFVLVMTDGGAETFRFSFRVIVLLLCLFFVFRYVNRALHTIYQSLSYESFMRKHNRKSVRNNEINLSLGNSLLSVLVWMTFVIVVVLELKIPTGSLSLVAGGLSAGIGLALKDILNNFIYGIQLMSGRLRVGDWIECDGIRGRVTDISYQSTQIETPESTSISFLNAALFAKNFTNLTKSNSYEFLKIIVGVPYGTDFQKVRETIEKAMEVMRTKDSYGREVVEPGNGIYVRFSDFGGSAVEVAVKQYVLVAERIAYIDRAKEVIYNALNEAGITIPFPQCDVHLIKDE